MSDGCAVVVDGMSCRTIGVVVCVEAYCSCVDADVASAGMGIATVDDLSSMTWADVGLWDGY